MLLELRGIQKRFGGVQALADGNLSVAAGEAHLLLGENGAGKPTLMKIMAMPMAAACAGVLRRTSRPSQSIWPASRSYIPATIFIKVDFPAPFSPSSRWASPAATERFPSAKAWTPPNRF